MQNPGTEAKRKGITKLYAGHPYANFAIGTREGLKAITRQDLVDFHRRYYTADNLVIALVGDLDMAQAKKLANRISGKLGKGKRAEPLPQVPAIAADETRVDFPSTQSHIMLAHIAV